MWVVAGDRSDPFFYSNLIVFAGFIEVIIYDGPTSASNDTIRIPIFSTISHMLNSTGT